MFVASCYSAGKCLAACSGTPAICSISVFISQILLPSTDHLGRAKAGGRSCSAAQQSCCKTAASRGQGWMSGTHTMGPIQQLLSNQPQNQQQYFHRPLWDIFAAANRSHAAAAGVSGGTHNSDGNHRRCTTKRGNPFLMQLMGSCTASRRCAAVVCIEWPSSRH